MSNNNERDEETSQYISEGKRTFLKLTAAAVTALALNHTTANIVTANENKSGGSLAAVQQQTIDLGSGDIGIMNFAFLLEQLEADFYTRVAANFFSGATDEERQILIDLRDHEITHREFFRATLGANAIPTLQFDFSLVDFSNRDSVLTNAQELEDTGVAACNGVGYAIQNTNILVLAGKIVSVEGRHAAAIRDLRIPLNTFFAPHPFDFALDPLTVLIRVAPFIPRTVTINSSGLPRVAFV